MIKRCQTCSTTIDSGIQCDDCLAPIGVLRVADLERAHIDAREAAQRLGKSHETIKQFMTLPTDSKERKNYPILSGCINYFPAALAGVANISKTGNDKHNPGEPLHHARGKSMDHADCIVRHMMDLQDLLARKDRHCLVGADEILTEASSLAWRALALSQELYERFGAPLAPGAKNR